MSSFASTPATDLTPFALSTKQRFYDLHGDKYKADRVIKRLSTRQEELSQLLSAAEDPLTRVRIEELIASPDVLGKITQPRYRKMIDSLTVEAEQANRNLVISQSKLRIARENMSHPAKQAQIDKILT